jgi:hypothetical protein
MLLGLKFSPRKSRLNSDLAEACRSLEQPWRGWFVYQTELESCTGRVSFLCSYPVEFLLELLSSDMTSEQILADYADLEADDFRAACAYGARLSRVQRVEPLAA